MIQLVTPDATSMSIHVGAQPPSVVLFGLALVVIDLSLHLCGNCLGFVLQPPVAVGMRLPPPPEPQAHLTWRLCTQWPDAHLLRVDDECLGLRSRQAIAMRKRCSLWLGHAMFSAGLR